MNNQERIIKSNIELNVPEKTNLISDISVWKNPDRNYFIFVILSVLFGFFGFDHFYLRSFGTGFAKLFSNFTMFGFWYFYDLLQIFQDKCSVQTKGLNSPFDWIRGIGKGTFDFKQSNQFESKKSFFVFGILVLLFGMFGLDKFYVGSYSQGFAKLIFNFLPFFFLFGWFWTFYDRYLFLVKPDSIMKNGIDTPLPFNWFFSEPINVSEQFEVHPIVKEENETWFSLSTLFAPFISFFTNIFNILPWRSLYESLIVPIIRPPVQSAISTGNKVFTVGKAGYDLGTKIASESKETISNTFNKLEQFSDPSYISDLAKQQLEKQTINPIIQQQGGGEKSSIGPVIAGSLTALLLAGSLKAFSNYLK